MKQFIKSYNISDAYHYAMVCCLALAIFSFAITSQAHAAVPRSNIVVDGHTGKVLSQYRADQKRYPASLTKVMTIYLLLEAVENGKLTLESKIPVSARAARQPSSKLYLKAGEKISVKFALEALVIKSANDVATAVAEFLGGSESDFAKLMTYKARKFGMLDTTFANASGLYNWSQVTTARDMGVLARRVLHDFPDHRFLWSQSKMVYRGKTYRSHNRLLGTLPGAMGLKTGYIRAAGYNVISAIERDGKHIITVIIGGKSSRERDRTAVSLTETNIHRASIRKNNNIALPIARPKYISDRADTGRPKITNAGFSNAAIVRPIANNFGSDIKPIKNVISTACSVKNSSYAANGWSIQFGAFAKADQANQHLKSVLQSNTQMVEYGTPQIQRPDCDGSNYYRARLAGLDKQMARQICSRMARKSGCFPIAPTF
ncbi:D-alanyl-D-alanine carboxypeptidase [Alphaproteobacteria bacterium]|nr:D-alanyl-D-alanine carboxypeptidase [Alphaproteobacteria bacterium]